MIKNNENTIGLIHIFKDPSSDSNNPVTKLLDIPIKEKIGGNTEYLNNYDLIVFKTKNDSILNSIKKIKNEGTENIYFKNINKKVFEDILKLRDQTHMIHIGKNVDFPKHYGNLSNLVEITFDNIVNKALESSTSSIKSPKSPKSPTSKSTSPKLKKL